jgi:hypothetical protein
VVQPISKTTITQNCLFDEFRRTYNMAYDLQFEGCSTFRPNPHWNALSEANAGVDTPHCCTLERELSGGCDED